MIRDRLPIIILVALGIICVLYLVYAFNDSEPVVDDLAVDVVAEESDPVEGPGMPVRDDTPLSTQEVSCYAGAPDTIGYYVEPSEPGNYPGVVMIHEWWGLNDHIKEMAEIMAQDGYRVLAVDLYNGRVAETRDEAMEYRITATEDVTTPNLEAAVAFLRERNATKVASFGWCFGGGKSLELAMSGVDLDATVIYYGTVTDDREALSEITWPVLGIFGEEDTSIPVENVTAFVDTLADLGVDQEVVIYPGVGHAFANPSNPNHAPAETAAAWSETRAFLARTLK